MEMMASLPRTLFFSGSSFRPRNSRPSTIRARRVGGVLAHAGGEDHGVQAAHGGGTGADALGDLVAEDVDSQLGALVALGSGGLQVTEVGGDAGDAQHAGLLVQGALHALGGVPRWSTM